MKNIFPTIYLVLAVLFGSVGTLSANSVNGNFVCEVFFRDGSSSDYFITTTSTGMKSKYIKYSDESEYVEIHKGETNDFRVFVKIGNFVVEDVVVLSATRNPREFHYNGTGTHSGDDLDYRIEKGICNKL
jgi:hypothetical protein